MKKYNLLFIMLAGQAFLNPVKAADNVHFSGTLIADSCTLPDSDKDIHIDFGSVIEKNIYQSQRTKSQPFTVHLQDCNPTTVGSVSVTFQGTADTELTDMLALDTGSSAKGVAIGLETTDGKSLPVNKATPYMQLTSGNNSLTFNAFVQVQPTVAMNKTLVAGEFTATSTFILSYQ